MAPEFTARELLQRCRILPVLTPVDVADTAQAVQALARGGLVGVEVTLRTPAAMDALRAVKAEAPDVLLAAGTVTTPQELHAAHEAGCALFVSPGISAPLLDAAREASLCLVPGVATASEIMLGRSAGLDCFKLFPATAIGGLGLLRAFAGPFPDVAFCPTGGISRDNITDFMLLDNVICCGGSWMVATQLMREHRWDQIEKLAKEALAALPGKEDAS